MLFGLPRRAGLFWLLVVVAAGATLAASWFASWPAVLDLLPLALLFAIVAGVAERIQVRLGSSRPGGDRVVYSIASTVYIAVVLLFPLPLAASIAAVGSGLGVILRGQRNPQKLLFNAANMSLDVAAASAVWSFGGRQLESPLALPWIALAAITYFVLNTGIIAAIVAFVADLPVALVWRRGHRNVLLANLALLAAGVPVAGLWLAYPWMLICLGIALLGVHRAMADRVKLETKTLDSLFQLADILDDRDKYTHGHSERVGKYAEQLAIQLGLSSDRAHLTFLAGRLRSWVPHPISAGAMPSS